jgi:hypothetical protein
MWLGFFATFGGRYIDTVFAVGRDYMDIHRKDDLFSITKAISLSF